MLSGLKCGLGKSMRDYILCLWPFWTFTNFVGNILPLAQRLIAVLLDGGKMNEKVLTLAGIDETESLGITKPFNFTLWHCLALLDVTAVLRAPSVKKLCNDYMTGWPVIKRVTQKGEFVKT